MPNLWGIVGEETNFEEKEEEEAKFQTIDKGGGELGG